MRLNIDIENADWPRRIKLEEDIIEVEGNIDYDPENAFWIAESRGKEAKNESVN